MVSPLFATPFSAPPPKMPSVRSAPDAKFLIGNPLSLNVMRDTWTNPAAQEAHAMEALARATKEACRGCQHAKLERTKDRMRDVTIYSVSCKAQVCRYKEIEEGRLKIEPPTVFTPIDPIGYTGPRNPELEEDVYRAMRDLAAKYAMPDPEPVFEPEPDVPNIEGAGAW